MIGSGSAVGDPAFWRGLYARGEDRWELGRPNPSLAAHLLRAPLPPGRVGVPGCGRGHDCRLLARHGHRVWGFDFVPETIQTAEALAVRDRVAVTFETRDVFALPAAYPGFFDAVWEYTSFCAIDPERRREYVAMLAAIMRPGGWLLACFFPIGEGRAGPPFPATEAELRGLLAPRFEIVDAYVPTASAPGRLGREWMVTARRSTGDAGARPAAAPSDPAPAPEPGPQRG